jgi:MFS family permease
MNPWKSLKGLPHDMWVLFFTSLINRSGTMVLPFLTLYLTKKIGTTPAEAGLTLLVYGIAAFLAAPLTGKIADKASSLKVMKFSLFGSGIIFIVYSFITNYYLILFASFILAAINEAFRPANLSMISELVEHSQRRIAFALNRLAINAGMSIGPVIGGFLSLFDFHLLFYANALSAIAAGIYLSNVKWTSLQSANHLSSTEKEKVKINVLSDTAFLFFLVAIIPVNLVFFQHIGALPLYIVDELGYTTAAFGLLSAINTVMIIFLEVPMNDYLSNISYKRSMIAGAMLAAIGFGLFAFANSIISLIIAIAIFTFGEMIFFPVTAAYTSEVAPEKRKGEYMGYYQMTFSFAFSAGPWLGTVVFQNYGSTVLWLGALVFGFISALLLMFLKKSS